MTNTEPAAPDTHSGASPALAAWVANGWAQGVYRDPSDLNNFLVAGAFRDFERGFESGAQALEAALQEARERLSASDRELSALSSDKQTLMRAVTYWRELAEDWKGSYNGEKAQRYAERVVLDARLGRAEAEAAALRDDRDAMAWAAEVNRQTADTLRDDNERLRLYVEKQEWAGFDYWCDGLEENACPKCWEKRVDGHKADCELAAALAPAASRPVPPLTNEDWENCPKHVWGEQGRCIQCGAPDDDPPAPPPVVPTHEEK